MSVKYVTFGGLENANEDLPKKNYELKGFTLKKKKKKEEKTQDIIMKKKNKKKKSKSPKKPEKKNNIFDELKEIPDEAMNPEAINVNYGQIDIFPNKKDEKDLAKSLVNKRPYSAHGYKVKNKNLKLTRSHVITSQEDHVKAYKEYR